MSPRQPAQLIGFNSAARGSAFCGAAACVPPRRGSRPGFTIVELLTVLAIVGLLLSLLLPAMNRARDTAHLAVCASNLRQTGSAITAYAADNLTFLPPYCSVSTEKRSQNHHARWLHNPVRSRLFGVGFLWRDGFVRDGRVFYCPAQKNPQFTYDYYAKPSYPSSMYLDTEGSVEGTRSGYYYNPQARSKSDRMPRIRQTREMTSAVMLQVDLLERPTGEIETTAHIMFQGYKVQLGDQSVRFTYAPSVIQDRLIPTWHTNGYDLFDAAMERLIRDKAG